MEKYQDWARVGDEDEIVVTAPLATITVKLASTDTLATLFSNNGVTPMANPFTAAANGYFFFYAADGRYDITVTPADVAQTPYTLGDVLLDDPLS